MQKAKENPFLHPTVTGRLLLHLVFWMALFLILFYLLRITFNVYSSFPASVLLLLSLYNTALTALVYYLLMYRLWPQFIRRSRYLAAAASLLLLLFLYTVVDSAVERAILFNCTACMVLLEHNQAAYSGLIHSQFWIIVNLRKILVIRSIKIPNSVPNKQLFPIKF